MKTVASEITLLKKCLKGNSQAFESIVVKYQDLICAITFSGTTDVQRSEELAHQTFINAWKNLFQLKDLTKFQPWLCTIARNNIRDFLKKSQRDIIAGAKSMESVNDAAADESGPLESAINKEREELVSDTIRQIPPRYREPLVLYYRQQQSVKQVARALDLSEDAVKQRLRRGRKMIKKQLSSIVEDTLSTTGPKKAFTTAVIASVAGIAIKGSGVAAAATVTAAAEAGSTTTATAIMSGVTAKIITAATVVVVGVGAVVTYRQVTKPDPEHQSSQPVIAVQQQKEKQEKATEKISNLPNNKKTSLSGIDKSGSDLEHKKTSAAPIRPIAVKKTINLGIHVFDDKTGQPLENANLRVNRGRGKPNNYSTDANGFYLIDFGEKKPSYLSIVAKKAGYVPMMFAWRDKMLKSLSDKFAFYLPKGRKIGGVVVNESSKPIPSTTVTLGMHVEESKEYPWIRIDDHKVITDANGRWQCDIFPDEPRQFSVKLKHPQYADTRIWIKEPEYKFEDFYNTQSVLVMKKGILLSGWVTDSEGRPIEGASVFTGEDRYDRDAPKIKTGSEGQFEFHHFLPQLQREAAVLTVQAKGFAPELKLVPISPDTEPVIIALGPPNTIRVRVVDVNGNPVSGAWVNAENWRGYRTLNWQSKTDKDGRFLWNEAPADQVEIDVYKKGYMRIANQMFVAQDEEHEAVMLPPLVISGSVVDAETNEPIKAFTATKGMQWESGSLHWQKPSQFSYNGDFNDGKYKISINHPYPGHLVRIDAEGYQSAKSRAFDSNEGSVKYDFRLEKSSSGPIGIVYDPNGSPAIGAEIYVLMENKHLHFRNRKPTNPPQDTEWASTDEDGAFILTGLLDEVPFKLVIMHDKGFTEITKQQWLKDPNITLQQWGRVEGILYSGLKPAANQGVHFYNRDSHNNPERMNYYYSINADTNEQGYFTIKYAVPGRGAISRIIVSDNGRRRSYSNSENVEVVAGQTTYFDIGGGGRLITGMIVKPEWATDTTGLNYANLGITPAQTPKINPYEILGEIEFPRPQNFDQMTVAEVMQWFANWAKSEEGRAFQEEINERMGNQQKIYRHYNVITEFDGNFKIVDVLPGEYILTGKLYKVGQRGHPDYSKPAVAEIKHTFTVDNITEENQDIPVDLGIVEFSPVAKLELNQPLPGFSVRSLDGGTLKLTDFRGKYLLMTSYVVTGSESLNKDMATLRRIQQDFADDERFEMIALTYGAIPLQEELTKKFLLEQGLTWKQGIIDVSNHELLQTYKIQNWPQSFLIDPNGILLANSLKDQQLYDAVDRALAE